MFRLKSQTPLWATWFLFACFGLAYVLFRPGPLDKQFNCDFFTYYCALKFNAETGRSPYQPWTGRPETTEGSELRNYGFQKYGRATYQFVYPPSAAPELWPMSVIPRFRASDLTWRAANLAVLGLILLLMAERAGERRPGLSFAVAAAAMLWFGPTLETLFYGQVSICVTALILVYLWGLDRNRGWVAGLALGLAISFKVYPLFWAPLAWIYPRARTRAFLGMGTAAVGAVLLSLVILGPQEWGVYARDVLGPMALRPPSGTISLNAFFSSVREQAALPAERVLFHGLFYLIYLPATAVLTARPRSTAGSRRRAALVYSSLILLAMPLTWEHYMTTLGALLIPEWLHWGPRRASRFPNAVFVLTLGGLLAGGRWALPHAVPPLAEGSRVARSLGAGGATAAAGLLAVLGAWRLIDAVRRREPEGLRRNRDSAAALGLALLAAALVWGAGGVWPDWKLSQLALTVVPLLPAGFWLDVRLAAWRRARRPVGKTACEPAEAVP